MIALDLFLPTQAGADAGRIADRITHLDAVFAAARSPARFGRLAAHWRRGADGRPVLAWHMREQRP